MSKLGLGIVDEPILSAEEDDLDITGHAAALTSFIGQCATPLTIGVQGEWGSGKTSLINSIWEELKKSPVTKQIWINAWENALLCTPEESLLKITNEILDELLATDSDKQRRDKISKAASSVFRSAVQLGTAVSLGAKAADIATDMMDSGGHNSIKALRQNLIELVQEIRDRGTNPYERVVIYIDDLDRIEPKHAVTILELLKNIFSIPNCVFVLAIDYQVVVKGLEDKFGPQTEENEWEFRAFFDKIIQLPFMMPTGKYNIAKYVTNLLAGVGYHNSQEMDPDILLAVVRNTTGGNPRALKRLANSVALIQIFEGFDATTESSLISAKQRAEALFALVAMQIAHPDIYEFLSKHPRIDEWTQALAYQATGGKEEGISSFQQDFALACQTEDFDEEWEQVLYRVCYPKPRYRRRAADISRLITALIEQIIRLSSDQCAQELEALLSRTSVTNVASSLDAPESKTSWKSDEEKEEANALWNLILDELQGTEVFSKGSRKGSSGVIRLSDKRFPLAEFVITQNKVGIALRLNKGSLEENLAAFDQIFSRREEYQQRSNLRFSWVRKETSRRQSIILEDDDCDSLNTRFYSRGEQVPSPDGWTEIVAWLSEMAPRAEAIFIEMLNDLNAEQ